MNLNRYVKVYSHKGFPICTLKVAIPANGDLMGYVIDHKDFQEKNYNCLEDAIQAIDKYFSN